MEEKDSHLRDRFCYTMERAGLQMICESVILINNLLLLYDKADKPGVLLTKKIEIRHQLEQSDYMIYFPFNDIHLNLNGNLANYYNKFISCNAVGLLHRRSFTWGRSVWSLVPGILGDTSLQLLHCKHTEFDFSTLAIFKPIVNHLFLCGFFRELIKMIDQYTHRGPLQHTPSDPPDPTDPPDSTMISTLFNEGGYELFCHLNENYPTGNKYSKTMFSNIYRFLKYENKLLGTKADYMNFINKQFKVSMTRILRLNYKYDDEIFPVLARLKSTFDKKQ